MNIALCHFRVGETDGVSLEMKKWKRALAMLGHNVYYLAGSTGTSDGYIIPELHYQDAQNNKLVKNAYQELTDYNDQDELKQALLNTAGKIEKGLNKFIKEYGIELLILNNIWSLGWGIPAAIAFIRVSQELGVKCIAHHHDFYWERKYYRQPTGPVIKEILQNYFPPDDELITHVVINSIAQAELKRRKGLNSIVIPNVFDFKQPLWKIDQYNQDLKVSLGIGAADLVILQATRVAERKAIELAIEVVGQLEERRLELNGFLYDGRIFTEESQIILLIPGLLEAESKYIDFLKRLAEQRGVKICWANSLIKDCRLESTEKKYYSLWDAYAIADLITYPSMLEGWGNQLLEGLFAKKPMVIFEYPVYQSDIKEKGFSCISLGDTYHSQQNGYVQLSAEKITEAATQSIYYLKEFKQREQMVERNFLLGEKYFSEQVLQNLLEDLLNKSS
ncbi:MAG: glycosyltransferase family 4 protein [Halanaerobiales bacterium]|nr:glycosyltransferase family 4 protein [Halanaerobiales bacterium]